MRIEKVSEGAPAEKSGVVSYDLVTKVNGVAIQFNDPQNPIEFDGDRAYQHFSYLIKKHKPGSIIKLEILRDGTELLTKEVTLIACNPHKPYFFKEQHLTPELEKTIKNPEYHMDEIKQDRYYKFWHEDFVKKRKLTGQIN